MDAVTRDLIDGEVVDAALDTGAPGHRHAPADLSAAVYGTLLVTGLVAVQARSNASPEFVAVSLLIGVGVFWLTEVWTGLVALRVHAPIAWADVRALARVESPMLTAALIPSAIVAIGILEKVPVQPMLDIALVACLVQLFLWGLAVGRRLGKGRAVTLLVAGVDVALGLLIVILKVVVLH